MSKRQNNVAYVACSKGFDDYRNNVITEFDSESIFFKSRMTQGLFWTSLDKDLANQMVREERWIFGMKYKDVLKLIDHGNEGEIFNTKGVGFKK